MTGIRLKRKPIDQSGFTLLETVVALGIFLAVVVPLMHHMTSATRMNKGKQKMVAACILEQEAAILRMYPDEMFTSKQRHVKGVTWTVKASIQGDKLKTCHLEVFLRNKRINHLSFTIKKVLLLQQLC